MSVTIDYLNEYERSLGTPGDDAATATALGVSRMSVWRYRNGRKTFGEDIALQVAARLDIDPGIILAELYAERNTDDAVRTAWIGIASRLRETGTEWRKR